jgi:transcription antitermination factor NusG
MQRYRGRGKKPRAPTGTECAPTLPTHYGKMLKFEANPPMLPSEVPSVANLAGDWWVAHTKARNEKSLAHDLNARAIGYYLPMVERVRMSGGRKRRLMLPLFTSYVFFCGGLDERYAALATNRVCQVIEVTDRPKFVTELLAVEQAVNSKLDLELHPFAVVGRRCRVTAGPLQGKTGTIIRRDKHTRLLLWVGILGCGASLEIDADLLEPID